MQRGLNQSTKIPHNKGDDQDCRENLQVDKFFAKHSNNKRLIPRIYNESKQLSSNDR